jgi:site-specific recombinase XerD
MSQLRRPKGHLQVKIDKNGRTRSFWAFWRDRNGRKGGRCLGDAEGGAGVLETILEELRTATEVDRSPERTLQKAVEGWLAERKGERGLKRSTVAGYEDMFERLFRDLGAETTVRSLADGRLRAYFADFKSYRVLSEAKAREALAAGKNAQQLTIERWTVRNKMDTTKTSDSEAIPMTPRLTRALSHLRSRGYAIGDHDFVFVSELTLESPVSERPIRHAFKVAADEAGLKPIKMYNLHHSFGTTLARNGVDIRTIQALMRHDRLSTTEQYVAYSPRPDLAAQIARALDPHGSDGSSASEAPGSLAAVLEQLEEQIPARWLREVERVLVDQA